MPVTNRSTDNGDRVSEYGSGAIMKLAAMLKSFGRDLFVRALVRWYRMTRPPRVLLRGREMNAAILRGLGAQIGANALINAPLVLHDAFESYERLTIGDNCFLNGNNFLDLNGRITLEDGVSLGPGVTIMTHNSYNSNAFLIDRLAHTCGRGDVLVRRGANIKAHALITMGTDVGEDAVVAGGSVVNQDVPARHLVAGNPAKIVTELL